MKKAPNHAANKTVKRTDKISASVKDELISALKKKRRLFLTGGQKH